MKDVNPGPAGSGVFTAGALGSELFFRAYEPVHGEELWVSDGTAGGTHLLDDTCPGPCDSKPDRIVSAGATVYFTGNDGTRGYEAYSYEYLAGVTCLDINPGAGFSVPSFLGALGATLYLSADDGTTGQELFSASGPSVSLVKDVNPGTGYGSPAWILPAGSAVFLSAQDYTNGRELWKLDGATGAVLVADIQPGIGSSWPSAPAAFGGCLFFAADDGAAGDELWKSCGSAGNTALFADLNAGAGSYPRDLAAAGPLLFFAADDGTHGRELWATDGASTFLVADIAAGPAGSDPLALTAVGSRVFFTAADGTHGRELWVSDGTPEGTRLALDIQPGVGSGVSDSPWPTPLAGKLIFVASDGAHGHELWLSDGTAAGTALIGETVAGTLGEPPAGLTVAGARLFFQAETPDAGRELWALPIDEFVTRPALPSGPTAIGTGTGADFTASGSLSLLGHPVEYRFDWGDGSFSEWSATPTAAHAWLVAGSYAVRTEARCASEPAAVSQASLPLAVAVGHSEAVGTPANLAGPAVGDIWIEQTFRADPAATSLGHPVQYRFWWGNGGDSDWVSEPSAQHAWGELGTYEVRVEARCALHQESLSALSAPVAITIVPQESVSAPAAPSGPNAVAPGTYEYAASGGLSSRGDDLEYRFEWVEEGTFSEWSANPVAQHEWTAPGLYRVRAYARCAAHPEKQSGSSADLWVTVETLTLPDPPLDPGEIAAAQNTPVGFGGGGSSLDHTIEYQLDWGDGTLSEWTTESALEHAWSAPGAYGLRARVRCQGHPAIVSGWSGTLALAVDSVAAPSPPEGPEEGLPGATLSFSVPPMTTALGHDVEYRFGWGDGTETEWSASPSASHAWDRDHLGDNQIAVTARCASRPEIVSEISPSRMVWIGDPESVSTPGTPWGRSEGETGEPYEYFSAEAFSSRGDSENLEYRFDWGDGTFSEWSASTSAPRAWSEAGTYSVRTQARCALHGTVSAWSAAMTATIFSAADNAPRAFFTVSPDAEADCPETLVFDASGSYHGNPHRQIVAWEWDFDYDGESFEPDAAGERIAVDVGVLGSTTVALRVTDNNEPGKSDLAATTVTSSGEPPVADAGGPYLLDAGNALALSAARSADPDKACGDAIESYRWDLDNDGLYGDAEGPTVRLGWADVETLLCGGACAVGATYPVSVLVTDTERQAATAATTVEVRAHPGTVKLVSPNGGEFLGRGETAALRWLSDAAPDQASFQLSADGGRSWKPLVPDPGSLDLASGTALWTVPESAVPGRGYRMKVTARAGGLLIGSDPSDASFAVGGLDITAPEAGAELDGGAAAVVAWDLFTSRTVARAVVKYTADGGASWKSAAGALRADASAFDWLVPAAPARRDRCRLSVALYDDAGALVAKDAGQGFFSIRGAVDVTFPEGGDALWGGTARTVTWDTGTAAAVGSVLVKYSLDGGASWRSAGRTEGNPGSFDWAVPDVTALKGRCKVRVILESAPGRAIAQDTGGGLFQILPLP